MHKFEGRGPTFPMKGLAIAGKIMEEKYAEHGNSWETCEVVLLKAKLSNRLREWEDIKEPFEDQAKKEKALRKLAHISNLALMILQRQSKK